MAQEWAKTFYSSKAWWKCKNSYIKQRITVDGGMCEECHDMPGYIVHHKVKLTPENINNAEISLNHDNLEYVCKKCHDSFDDHGFGFRKKIKPLCTFDKDGQPISLREIDREDYQGW